MLINEPICVNCKHFDLETFTCKAFPEGIPVEIIEGDNDHKKPLPDQNNDLVFEKVKR
jgi:hypothetical protein